MPANFESIQNYLERGVFDAIAAMTPHFQHLADKDLMADVACVALNRLPPRYIRHEIDLVFYMTEKERTETALAIEEAVSFALEFVQARHAMRARR